MQINVAHHNIYTNYRVVRYFSGMKKNVKFIVKL